MISLKSRISNFIINIKKSEFAVNVSTLVTGSVISQIIPFFAAPIISRLYFPEDYALVAAYSSITVLLTIVATGMYSSALMIDKTDGEAFNTGLVALVITIAITTASSIVLFFFNDAIASLTGNENINLWLYLVPLTVFFTGGYQTLNMWNNRKKRYKRLAANRIIQTLVTTGATIAFGFLSYHSTGLMISLLVGQMFAFSLLFIQSIKDDGYLIAQSSFTGIKTSFKRHIAFPKYNMPQGFLDGFRESSIVLIISNFFGPTVLGSYTFANSVLSKPVQIIGNAFGQICFQKSSYSYNQGGELWQENRKYLLILIFIFLPIIPIFILLGEKIFVIFFGDKWLNSGLYSGAIAIWLYAKVIITPLYNIPIIIGKQKNYFVRGAFLNTALPSFLYISIIVHNNFIISIYSLSLFMLLYTTYMIYWFNKITKLNLKENI